MRNAIKDNKNSYKIGHAHNNVKLFIALFIFCLVLRDVVGIPLNRYVFIGAAALLFTFCDEDGMVRFIAFITPLSQGISYSYITFISVFFLLFKRRGRLELNFGALPAVAIIVIELLNMFYPDSSLVDFFRTSNIFILLVLLFLDKQRNYDYKMVLKYYLFGFFILSAFTFFWIYRFGSIEKFFQYGTTLGDDLVSGVEGNIIFAGNNIMGLFAVISIAVGLLLFYTNAANRLLLTFIISLGFVMGFVSTSRGFIFSTLLCVILFIFVSIRNLKSFIKALTISILLVLTGLLLINTILRESYITFMSKMRMADFSNGRLAAFRSYMEFFFSSIKVFFIGVGIQDYQVKAGQYVSIHNAVQEVLIAWGSLGLISVIAFFTALYKSAVSNIPKKNRKVIYLIPSLVYLFYVQLNQLFTVTSVMLVIVVAYSSIALNSEQSCKVKKRSD